MSSNDINAEALKILKKVCEKIDVIIDIRGLQTITEQSTYDPKLTVQKSSRIICKVKDMELIKKSYQEEIEKMEGASEDYKNAFQFIGL